MHYFFRAPSSQSLPEPVTTATVTASLNAPASRRQATSILSSQIPSILRELQSSRPAVASAPRALVDLVSDSAPRPCLQSQTVIASSRSRAMNSKTLVFRCRYSAVSLHPCYSLKSTLHKVLRLRESVSSRSELVELRLLKAFCLLSTDWYHPAISANCLADAWVLNYYYMNLSMKKGSKCDTKRRAQPSSPYSPPHVENTSAHASRY